MTYYLDKIREIDYHIYFNIYRAGLSHHFLSNLYYFFARYGIVFFFLAFIYLILYKRVNALLCSLLAMGLAGLMDFLITIIWSRPRPFISHHDLMTPVTKGLAVDISSFPSGHTYIVFAIAISIYLYGHRRLGVGLFLLAVLVAIARIGTGVHYPSDVVAGVLLGLAAGSVSYLTIERLEKYWE